MIAADAGGELRPEGTALANANSFRTGTKIIQRSEAKCDVGQSSGQRWLAGVCEMSFSADAVLVDLSSERGAHLGGGSAECNVSSAARLFHNFESLVLEPTCHFAEVAFA